MFVRRSSRVGLFALLVSSICAGSAPGQAAPAGGGKRPNVIVVLVDDVGFSDVGCYGGEIKTPNVDRMASEGVRFGQFYNMARCCPTRASLMTGLYPHQAGMGNMNQNMGKPAYQGEINDRCVTMAEALRASGYHTGMVGKWHLVHLNIAREQKKAKGMLNFELDEPISPTKDNWPCNRGFEDHWGTIPGVDSFYDPYGLVHNEETIKPPAKNADGKPFYYTDFITDHAVEMIDRWSGGEKPFFMYVAYTAAHWPMQAPEEDVAPYADTYKVGWDKIREARFDRQVEMGLAKKEWGLSPRAFNKGLNDGASQVGPWDDAPEKAWQARRMAVYAGMLSHMDRGLGRIMDELKAKGVDDNTAVIFLSDNGACQENVQAGWYDIPTKTRDGRTIHVGNDPKYMPGPEEVYQSYGPAWANASNTPFRRFKHFTEEGGISAPFIVRWPGGNLQKGRLELNAVGHVIDLMPTVMEVTGSTYPKTYNGHEITPEEGKSLVPVLTDKVQGSTWADRGPLCWEHEGNRAVRIGDWKLLGPHGEPWKLYNVVNDRTEMHDMSEKYPEKARELKDAYDAWAKRCEVEAR